MHLALLFVLLAGATDPTGWSKARWGMTEAQVLEAFPGQAVRVNEPIPACTYTQEHSAPIAIHDVPIGSTKYLACFFFVGGKLSSVSLHPPDSADNTEAEFDRVEALLVEKYGKPWQLRDKDQSESRWSLKTTRIQVYVLRFILGDFRRFSVTLRYEHRPPENNLD